MYQHNIILFCNHYGTLLLNIFSVGTVFIRQNRTSVEVFNRPHAERIEISITAVDPYHRYSNEAKKKLTKTSIMILN